MECSSGTTNTDVALMVIVRYEKDLYLEFSHQAHGHKFSLPPSLLLLIVLMIVDQADRFALRLKASIMSLDTLEDVQ